MNGVSDTLIQVQGEPPEDGEMHEMTIRKHTIAQMIHWTVIMYVIVCLKNIGTSQLKIDMLS